MANIPEEALLALAVKNKGGGGGTTNYNDLSNQPQIGGVTLSGNKSASDLGLADENTVQGILDGQSLDSFSDVETALSGKQASLTAGSYIRINDSDEISVKRLVLDGDVYKYDVYTNLYQTGAIVDKYDVTDQLISTRNYSREDLSTAVNIDDVFNFQYSGNTYSMTFLIASTESPVGTVVSWMFNNMEHHINSFELPPEETANDLIIRSELTSGLAGKASTADLAAKQDSLTAGNNIKIDDDTISVNRWALPAGDVIYTVITGSGDYGREIHVQRHTVGGTLIDDREYHIDTWGSQDVDNKIRLAQGYAQWNISLLADSKEHSSGYSYNVNPNTTETSNSFTFTLEQEENDNDLIIREELDAVSGAVSAIKDGQSIDSFGDVETALAGKQATLTFDDVPTDNSNNPVKSNGIYDALALKQNATDNNLETTSKTVVGAVNELKSGLTDLSDHVDGDAVTYPYADVITINDAVPANLADCSVKVEPVQDLHGYDKPWVGGAGKNKCAGTYTTTTNGGVTFTAQSDGTVKATNTSSGYAYVNSSEFTIKAGTYTFSGAPSGNTKYVLAIYSGATLVSQISNGTETDVTFESDTNIVVRCVVNGADVATGVTYKPMLRLSTESDATFAPYTNICPIAQYDSCKITRAGKNWFDKSAVTNGKIIDFNTGRLLTNASYYTSDYIPVISGDKYTFSGVCLKSSAEQWWYDKDKQPLQVAINAATKTVPNGAYYFRFSRTISDGYVGQIEKGSTATPYEPYKGNDYQIELNGNTYYGQLRIDTQGNVYFDVDRVLKEYDGSDDEGWVSYNDKLKYTVVSDVMMPGVGTIPNAIANYYEFVSLNYFNTHSDYALAYGDSQLKVRNVGDMSLSDWKTFLSSNNMQIVYPLATPFTIVLKDTPINLVKGQNTMYADTGDIEVTVNNTMDAIGSMQEQVNDHEERIEAVESGKVDKLTRISNNVAVTDTSATQSISSIKGCNILLFVTKINSSVRNTLLIPYALFKTGVDVYIPIAKQTTIGSLYVKYNSDTSITLFSTISDYNYLDIYGDK